jgi:hypothetical protein
MAQQLEEDVLKAALKALKDNFAALPVHMDELGTDAHYGARTKGDKLIRLTIGEKQIPYHAEIKNNLTRANIGLMIQRRNALPGPLLLVTNHVNDVMAERLKEYNIEFIDGAGNAYINQPPLYVYIKGNKPKGEYKIPPPGQAFRPTGLKVVFTFLCHPPIIEENYRTIARTAGVALGNIGGIRRDLKRQGFLLDMGKQGCRLIQQRRLLERFTEDYPKKLKPQLFLGNFRADPNWWQKEDMDIGNAFWGGEAAAAKMGNYLKPQTITVYVKQQWLNDFLLKNRLKKDMNGEVELYKLFWDPAALPGNQGLVNPILTYADLMATGDQRDIETAKVIYEKHVLRSIGED